MVIFGTDGLPAAEDFEHGMIRFVIEMFGVVPGIFKYGILRFGKGFLEFWAVVTGVGLRKHRKQARPVWEIT